MQLDQVIQLECLAQQDKEKIILVLAQQALDLEGKIIDYREQVNYMKGYNVEPDLELITLLEVDLVDMKRLIEAVHGLKGC